ncbi:MAG: Pyridoxal phosphate homeostasis protein [Hyphomicrobiales bacterium]|nr:Pyridoxal phosphate homeostasis protein [Hyphomicrobiales bacterium]
MNQSDDHGAESESDALLMRLKAVRENIARAALSCGRDPDSVTLVAASKTQDGQAIAPLIKAGQIVFGENRVQEAQSKWPALRALNPSVELRLIGPLQSNKTRDAVSLFDVIETLDRPSLARALASEIQRQGRQPRLYVEVNTGAEPQKAGVLPGEIDGFLLACRADFGLAVTGLMCVPPVGEQASPHFALLAKIASRHGLRELSMGMSTDYPLAIQLGATHVRVGTALFGSRSQR